MEECITVWPEIRHLVPELILTVTAVLLFLHGAFRPREQKLPPWIATLALVAAAAVLAKQTVAAAVAGAVTVDPLAWFFRSTAVAAGLLLVWLRRAEGDKDYAEETACLLSAIAGAMLAAAADDLLLVFVGLELISVPVYILLYLGGRRVDRQEAAAKYFFLSILASAVFLYGVSFLYGVAGTLRISETAAAFSAPSQEVAVFPLGFLGVLLIFAGLAFKITAVPFQFYAPDVYQGTTHANAALLSVIPKAAGLAVLVRLLLVAVPGLENYLWHVAMALSVLTMTVGNVLALRQKNLRRLLAYSAIAHAGYLLLGLTAALASVSIGTASRWDGGAAALVYLAAYVFGTIGVFAVPAALEQGGSPVDRVTQLAGLAWSPLASKRLLAWALAVCLFSLAGIPPLAGFWAKLAVLMSALDTGTAALEGTPQRWLIGVTVIGAVNAAIAAGYYLRVTAVLFFGLGEGETRSAEDNVTAIYRKPGLSATLAAAACMVIVLGMGLSPARWFRAADTAVRGLQIETPQASQVDDVENETAFFCTQGEQKPSAG
ncbi:MAG: NADH-quinone oxidoreductase subunit N [Planctomycetota bacterium]|nr:MAG: NADH-quinone oxidoreductase subunit N [Planctomycetota bacterium]